jgi:PAS domain S-box-containing protein
MDTIPPCIARMLRSGWPWLARLRAGSGGVLVGLLLVFVPVALAAPLRVGLEANSDPFTFNDARGEPTGFAYDLLRAVAADQQLELEYVTLPWPELLEEFKAGRIDIICNLVDTPERKSYIEFSATTIYLRGAIYTRRDAPAIRTTADLAGRKVATIQNSRAHEYLRSKDWGVEFRFFDSMLVGVDAVHDGRADLLVATRMVADYQIRQRGYTDLVLAPLELPDLSYREHFGVQPGRAALLAQLNEGLLAVQRNGTYDRLYEHWIGPIEPRVLRWRDLQPYALPVIVLLVAVLTGLVWQRRMLAQVQQQAEALRRSEEQLSLVIEGSQDGFWDWDLRSGQITRSPRWAEMLGYRLDEVEDSHAWFLDRLHPDDVPQLEADQRAVWAGRDRFELEFRLRDRSGRWIWILDRGKVVARDPATGQPLRIAGTHTDITSRKLAEQENEKLNRKMLETQKLESLGVLAGGIAHDFNNLLTVILANAALSSAESAASEAERERLATITTAARRAAELCRQLLAYAGKGAFVIERLDLNRAAQETARLLELSVPAGTIEFDLAPGLPAIEADPSQIQQIIMNLVINAAEAMARRPGHIRIRTSARELREGDLPDALPAGTQLAGAHVCLEVSDEGAGMTPEVLARIFDPFFTTKFTGRGLGLAAVLGIVRSHRGALTVRSEADKGSVFRIHLPVAKGGVAAAPAPATPVAPASTGAGTVLVADDESAVRGVVTEVLRRSGYEVVAAESGDEALRRFTAEPDRFRLVVLDITMPGLDGLSALRRMRQVRPTLPCVILSGHSEQDASGHLGGPGGTIFLQKPFELSDLLKALEGVQAGK